MNLLGGGASFVLYGGEEGERIRFTSPVTEASALLTAQKAVAAAIADGREPRVEDHDMVEGAVRAESYLMYEEQVGVAGDADDILLRFGLKASEGDVVEMEFQRTMELAREASRYTLDLEAFSDSEKDERVARVLSQLPRDASAADAVLVASRLQKEQHLRKAQRVAGPTRSEHEAGATMALSAFATPERVAPALAVPRNDGGVLEGSALSGGEGGSEGGDGDGAGGGGGGGHGGGGADTTAGGGEGAGGDVVEGSSSSVPIELSDGEDPPEEASRPGDTALTPMEVGFSDGNASDDGGQPFGKARSEAPQGVSARAGGKARAGGSGGKAHAGGATATLVDDYDDSVALRLGPGVELTLEEALWMHEDAERGGPSKERRGAAGRDDVDAALEARLASAPVDVQSMVRPLLDTLDEKQRAALHGILVVMRRVTVVSGPAGSGKSNLIKIVALLERDSVAVVAPTHGARRVNQQTLDDVLPRESFKPVIESLTSFTAFGVGFGQAWASDEVVAGIKGGETSKQKAAEVYSKDVVICDEAAQTPFSQLDMAKEVGPRVNGGKVQRFVLLMDGLQTPPVNDNAGGGEREMVWEGDLFIEAARNGELACYSLEKIYRTADANLLELSKALRGEDFDAAWPLVQLCSATVADATFVDVVHDNLEVYPIAEEKFGSKPGVAVVRARCEYGGPNEPDLRRWPRAARRTVREHSKMLLEVYVYPGQRLHYQPIGKVGVRTGSIPGKGWYLSKGEPIDVVRYHPATRQLEVTCPMLKGHPPAWIPEEFTWVNLGDGFGRAKLWGPPYRYSDIVTVYSAQGSQAKNVHVRASRFKGERNLLYTACTRAIEKLKISGIKTDDDGLDLLEKMQLHPKSVLWQARLGVQCFSAERVAAAQLEVDKKRQRVAA